MILFKKDIVMDFSFYQYLFAFFGAFLGGFIDAIIGGGGLVTLPLILGLGVPPALGVATNKLQGAMGMISSLLVVRKNIDFKKMFFGVIITATFAALGGLTLISINSNALKPVVAIILILVFLYTVFKKNIGETQGKARMKLITFLIIFGMIIGFYDGFIGPGTGSFWIFAFVSLLGFDIRQASINTKLLNAASNIASLVFFILHYEVLYKLGITMGIGAIIGANLGARVLLKVNIKIIKILFFVIVFSTLVKVCYDYFFI